MRHQLIIWFIKFQNIEECPLQLPKTQVEILLFGPTNSQKQKILHLQ